MKRKKHIRHCGAMCDLPVSKHAQRRSSKKKREDGKAGKKNVDKTKTDKNLVEMEMVVGI